MYINIYIYIYLSQSRARGCSANQTCAEGFCMFCAPRQTCRRAGLSRSVLKALPSELCCEASREAHVGRTSVREG